MNTTTTTGKPTNGHRLVLLPLPFQGHLNPMLQLANILHSKGFSITILHIRFNSPNPTNYPHFTFLPIPDTAGEPNPLISDVGMVVRWVHYINISFVDPIRGCLERLMLEDDGVACLITDALWFCTQSVADGLKLPRIVHRTSSISSFLYFASYSRDTGCFGSFSDEETKSKSLAKGLEPLNHQDLSKFLTSDPESACKVIELMVEGTKRARAVIWNTFKELEEGELEALSQDFPNPHFLIGPFHKYFPASSSSLLAQDQTSISWLDKHPPKSVLYVSFGSIVKLEKSEFLEIAWGLANSKQPFLWVVRPGSIGGSEWLEPLPDEFLERIVEGRGYIVKWAPQQDVLAHRATGGFWTHNGWNSTLESICEGVPMICSPAFGDQLPNARYVSDVWKIGVELQNGFEREEIESAIKRVMVNAEGLEFRNKITNLKWKVNRCLEKGGSSYSSLEDLECLERLMSEDDGVACLITDAQWFGTQSVAVGLKLPRIVHRTSSISSFLLFAKSLALLDTGCFWQGSDEERKSETLVQGLEPLKVKDLPKLLTSEPQGVCKVLELMAKATKRAQALIWNTFKELEEHDLEVLSQDFPNPHFFIGPFHKYFPAHHQAAS
ncbi:UDP-glycosyltransferase 76B1 isoform X2 [Helianthus annuus]|uniref:UDP-glycosyltransferase 76B1 isoform X2 n=1 Tax=Helianthus annuus TaxID=4232 RepID=UPI001652C6B4|nr:UDP-glycosyltransferase 76B1 isoform X2 [Helianthus annuus]